MELLDFDSWEQYDGFAEGSGRSEKLWIRKNHGIGLFKFPKSQQTTEHVSEKLASMLAELVDIPCANVDIGYRDGRIGSISYNVVDTTHQTLREGVWYVSFIYPDFDPDTLYCKELDEYYSIRMGLVISSSQDDFNQKYGQRNVTSTSNRNAFLKMLIFDALIGNSDRHQSNWAFILDSTTKTSQFCPLYDNGSSLCCYITDEQIESINRDKNRFNSIVDTKSRSLIRIDGKSKTRPTHKEMLYYIKEKYGRELSPFAQKLCNAINDTSISKVLSEFSDDILSQKKKIFIYHFLLSKRKIIHDIFINEV